MCTLYLLEVRGLARSTLIRDVAVSVSLRYPVIMDVGDGEQILTTQPSFYLEISL